MVDFSKMTKEELVAQYNANVAERKRLGDENKLLIQLRSSAVSTAKKSNTEKRIADLQARLAALESPAPVVSEVPVEG